MDGGDERKENAKEKSQCVVLNKWYAQEYGDEEGEREDVRKYGWDKQMWWTARELKEERNTKTFGQ